MTAPDLALAESDPAGFVLAVARVAELEAQTEEELRRGSTYWSGNECLQHERRWTPAQALVEVALWRGVAERHGPTPIGPDLTVGCRVCRGWQRSRLCPEMLAVVAAARAYIGESS